MMAADHARSRVERVSRSVVRSTAVSVIVVVIIFVP